MNGYDHFFDSRAEMESALGLGANARRLVLDGYSLSEMRDYLKSRGFDQELPDWLPNRPLLLGYLSRDNLLGEILASSDHAAPSVAWDTIVSRICEREANIHEYLDADSVRRILEHLSSVARSTGTGLGPISERDVFEAFRRVTSMDADEAARPLLMRLPGLSTRDQIEGGRSFLDDQMLDVLRAGDVIRFCVNPYDDPQARGWDKCMGPVGVDLAARRLRDEHRRSAAGRAKTACVEAIRRWDANVLALDLVQVARASCVESTLDFGDVLIEKATLPALDLGDGPLPRGLTLKSIVIGGFHAPESTPTDLRIEGCLFERVFGYDSEDAFPGWLVDCEAGEFDDAATNADILRTSELPLGSRVALTMLRKLFLQRGHGRKQNALSRGMAQDAQAKVRNLLPLLQSAMSRAMLKFARRPSGSTRPSPDCQST